MDPFINGIAN